MSQLVELLHGNIAALGNSSVALYVGLGLLMFANSAIMIPPSEYICITLGVLVANDKLEMLPAVLLAAVANLAGTFPWYVLGKSHKLRHKSLASDHKAVGPSLGSKIVHAYTGRLGAIEKLFREHGVVVVVMLRNVPVLRSIASYPAGRAGMSLWKFIGASSLGICIWVTLWSCLGFVLGALAHRYKWYLSAAVGILSLLILRLVLKAIAVSALRDAKQPPDQ